MPNLVIFSVITTPSASSGRITMTISELITFILKMGYLLTLGNGKGKGLKCVLTLYTGYTEWLGHTVCSAGRIVVSCEWIISSLLPSVLFFSFM